MEVSFSPPSQSRCDKGVELLFAVHESVVLSFTGFGFYPFGLPL
jgi:hypothetical protein